MMILLCQVVLYMVCVGAYDIGDHGYVVDDSGATPTCYPDLNSFPINVGEPDNRKCGPYMLYQWMPIASKPKPQEQHCWYSTCSKLIPVEKNCNGGCTKKSKWRKYGYVCRDRGLAEDRQNKAWVKCDLVCDGYGNKNENKGEVYIRPEYTKIYYQTVTCDCTPSYEPLAAVYENYVKECEEDTCEKKIEKKYDSQTDCSMIRPSGISMSQLRALKRRCRRDFMDSNDTHIADTVRLAFHDCVGAEGCNGCVDVNLGANGGLEKIIDPLSAYYTVMLGDMGISSSDFTLADWFALCGIAAAEKGFVNAGFHNFAEFKFKVGRPAKSSCVGDTKYDWPDSHGDFAGTMAFLMKQFGYDDEECVVAMGAHSLGKAHKSNSGHEGKWTEHVSRLDNEYYQVLLKSIAEKWHQEAVVHPDKNQYQWQKGDTIDNTTIMMLNADMVLVKDFQIDGFGDHGVAECTNDISQCSNSESYGKVVELAGNNAAFTRKFADVWYKMLHKVPNPGMLKFPYDYVEN